jgi:hypothetical protein
MKHATLVILTLVLVFAVPFARADWSASRRLTWNSGLSWDPAIAVDSSGAVHVVWYDNSPGNWEIYYKKSTNGGAAWSAIKRLTWTAGDSYSPAISANSAGEVCVVWNDDTPGTDEIYYRHSTDEGDTWTAAKRLTWDSMTANAPDIASDSPGYVHVVWYDFTDGNTEIFHKKSTNGGETWGTARRLTWTDGSSFGPIIAAEGSGIFDLFWYDNAPGNFEIYHKRSLDSGATWTANRRLTWTDGGSGPASSAIDSSGDLHLVWQDDTPGNREIYHKRSTDGGVTWTTNHRLTWTSGNSMAPSLVADSSDNLHAVWDDKSSGHEEIYYKTSTDGGTTWSANKRLTWTSMSRRTEIAIGSSDSLHVVWEQAVPSGYEIFYKKFTE